MVYPVREVPCQICGRQISGMAFNPLGGDEYFKVCGFCMFRISEFVHEHQDWFWDICESMVEEGLLRRSR